MEGVGEDGKENTGLQGFRPIKFASLPSRNTAVKRSPPWLGVDFGGTLAKLVYFEPSFVTSEEEEGLKKESLRTIRDCLTEDNTFDGIGENDTPIKNVKLHGYVGNMHFILFRLEKIETFIKLIKNKYRLNSINATGGGAYKFKHIIAKAEIELNNLDEFGCLMKGIHFLQSSEADGCRSESSINPQEDGPIVKEPFEFRNPYPYIVVNIGSAVSVSLFKSPDEQLLISATSVGGGTFLGLCCLLTGCKTFGEALALASRGESSKVDKHVCDIYGDDGYAAYAIPGSVIASSFGKMSSEGSQALATKEDLAKAVLVTVTNIIGHLVKDCALRERIQRVLFVGNFLRGNPTSMRLLASQMETYGRKAFFPEHGGFGCAVGALLASI